MSTTSEGHSRESDCRSFVENLQRKLLRELKVVQEETGETINFLYALAEIILGELEGNTVRDWSTQMTQGGRFHAYQYYFKTVKEKVSHFCRSPEEANYVLALFYQEAVVHSFVEHSRQALAEKK